MSLSYVFILIITNYYDVEVVGRLLFALSVHALLSTLCLFGTDNSTIFLKNDGIFVNNQSSLSANLFVFVGLWSFICCLLFVLLGYLIFDYDQSTINILRLIVSLPFLLFLLL